MVGRLRSALVCSPHLAGWNDQEKVSQAEDLGFLGEPDFVTSSRQHEELCSALRDANVELHVLPAHPGLTLDAVYTHDSSLVTDQGFVAMRPGKVNRRGEADAHEAFYEASGIPRLGAIQAPGHVEAGDVVWLDSKTLLVGRGFRSNPDGIRQLQELVGSRVSVRSVPLPYDQGPGSCLHLMSLLSMLDETTLLIDRPWLAVETLEFLEDRGFRLLDMEPSERATLACNVLALGDGRLLAIRENQNTNARLQSAGFDVRTFSGSALCVCGGGGPTCLTRPLWRENRVGVTR